MESTYMICLPVSFDSILTQRAYFMNKVLKMVFSTKLSSLLFLTLVTAMPDSDVGPRQNPGPGINCGIRGQAFSSCLGGLGYAFCFSFLAQQTVALRYAGTPRLLMTASLHSNSTTTTFVTSVLSTSVITASPPITSTINGSVTISVSSRSGN